MTGEQQLIFDWIADLPVRVPNWEKRLPMMYEELNMKWFDGTLPELTDDFVCEFCDMPRDSAGIFIDAETAEMRRRSIVIILHQSSQPPTTMVHDWSPKGLCKVATDLKR